MGFPSQGICEVCGGTGGDSANGTSADAPLVDAVGNGVPLEYRKGKLMCRLCKKQDIADEESRIAAERQADSQKFRDQAGFVRTI